MRTSLGVSRSQPIFDEPVMLGGYRLGSGLERAQDGSLGRSKIGHPCVA